jgi:hypothetical protein
VSLDGRDVREYGDLLLGIANIVPHGTDRKHLGEHFSAFVPVPDFSAPVSIFDQ